MFNFTHFDGEFKDFAIDELSKLLSQDYLLGLAKEVGFIKRKRDFSPFYLVMAMIFNMQNGIALSLARIHSSYKFLAKCGGEKWIIDYNAFLSQLHKPGFLKFITELDSDLQKRLFKGEVAADTAKTLEILQSKLPELKDIITHDGTKEAVNPQADGFHNQDLRGVTKPSIEVHASFAFSRLATAVHTITNGVSSEKAQVQFSELKDKLAIFDRGYFSYAMMIKQAKQGWVLMKVPSYITPFVVRYQAFDGENYVGPCVELNQRIKLHSDPNFGGQYSYDLIIRTTEKLADGTKQDHFFRLIKSFNPRYQGNNTTVALNGYPNLAPSSGYHYLMTNIPASVLDAGQVDSGYRNRWQSELSFKGLKQGCSLHPGKILTETTIKGVATASLLMHDLKVGIGSFMHKLAGGNNLSMLKVTLTGAPIVQTLIARVMGLTDTVSREKDQNLQSAIIEFFGGLSKSVISKTNRELGKGVACINKILMRPPRPASSLLRL